MTKIFACLTIVLALFVPDLIAQDQKADQPDKFLLLATSRTGTMQKELNEVSPDYEVAGMTVFQSRFGRKEAAVILQAEIKEE